MKTETHLKTFFRYAFFVGFVILFITSASISSGRPGTSDTGPAQLLTSQQATVDDLSSFVLGNDQYLTMKNPAAVYCRDLGYDFKTVQSPDGSQDGVCLLPGETTCPAWDFLGGKCGQEFSVCARNGMLTEIREDGNNPLMAEYAVCVDTQGTEKSAFEMTNLIDKISDSAPDLTYQEYTTALPAQEPLDQGTTALPTSFDWRNNGGDWLSPVKNQGMCGSCWSFSAVGVSEAAFNIAASNPNLDLDLSEQYLVTDCSSAGNCAGGAKGSALSYIRDYGIPDEGCLPYLDGGSNGCTYVSSTGACDSSKCTYYSGSECSDYRCTDRCSDYASRLRKISTVTYLGSSTTDVMKQAILDHGPLAVSLLMGGSFDSNNVYHCPSNSTTNHAVVAVGWNDANGGYWIIKNSWGTSWGTAGYFNVGYNTCAIQIYPYWASAASPGNPVPTVTSLSPIAAAAGGSSFTLTVYGTGFVSGASTVRWNGANRTTTFVSATELHASIPASDIASPGSASVTVYNSSPGGGTSNVASFKIYAPAAIPFTDGFEAGSLGTAWEPVVTDQGRVEVGSAYPRTGTYSLLLDDTAGDSIYSYASAVLHVNLAGYSSATLDFWWHDFSDEDDASDGVFIRNSSSGNWCQVMTFTSSVSSYTQATINLATAASNCGIAFSSDFQIKFQYYDNYPINSDGYTIDDVSVTGAQNLSYVYIPYVTQITNTSGPVNGNFEQGAGAGWQESSSNSQALILNSGLPIIPHSGSWLGRLGVLNSELSRLYQQVTVPSSSHNLSFWYWSDSADVCGYDYFYAMVNSTTLQTWNLCTTTNTGGWTQVTLDLSAYAGQNVTLEFRVSTDSSLLSTLYIDDVAFTSSLVMLENPAP
ncbi:MAG: C1 family peptidase [Chloroflexota bacterium]